MCLFTAVALAGVLRLFAITSEMIQELGFLVEHATGGGFVARALSESIFTEADSIDELRRRILDAIQCHFDEDRRPKVIRLHLANEGVIEIKL